MKIGLSLSGGGIRATIFHLGICKYLAEKGLLSSVTHISSVSGASLCGALIFAKSGNKWPSDARFLKDVLPAIRQTILKNNIQTAALLRLPFSPAYWGNRAALIAKVMQEKWGVAGTMRDLPEAPLWDINCTTFETGKDFRISRQKMGDYILGYVKNPDLPIASAAAASAGFPILIGPLKLDAKKYTWTETRPDAPREDTYYLWDGGVYDNLGLEALYKPDTGLTRDIDFLVLGNASCPSGYLHRNGFSSAKNLKRLLDISMDQVSALRSRDIGANVLKQNKGLYVNIGNSAEKIAGDAKVDEKTKRWLISACMP
ncbi:MAG: patatin-like phospholipase family protein, partial [Treponema sp.]|nr:patatin-like phospholipase family protein [Treponema sp.]